MRDNSSKSDLRVVKTLKVLNAAMFVLLDRNCFQKITVRDICDEALISRASFYARFSDKYDFLKNWLKSINPGGVSENETYEEIEETLNEFIYRNKTVIMNLICDADNETLVILSDFVLETFNLTRKDEPQISEHAEMVFAQFFTGGILSYFKWQARNKFSTGVEPINVHLYRIIKELIDSMIQQRNIS